MGKLHAWDPARKKKMHDFKKVGEALKVAKIE